MMLECDYLIIGGGAAGSVLAARLSESSSARIILLEAGRDVDPDRVPQDIADIFPLSTFNPDYTWPGLKVHWRQRENSPAVPFQQGRVLGGGSTIMGMWAVRGMPQDYDDWEKAGAAGWSWSSVLPYFRKIETDHDFRGDMHGQDGPLPIRRQTREEWSSLAQAMEGIAAARGHELIADMNADFRDGYCVLPISRHETRRASAGLCYLDGAARARPNLTVVTDAHVRKLIVEANQVRGAVARRKDGTELVVQARHTVLAAGAIFSPALLLRSGIGPGEQLKACGLDVVLEREGVGRNLQNHPLLPAIAWLTREGRDARRGRPPASTYLRWSSRLADTPEGDLGMYIRSYLVWHALGRHMAMVGPVLMRPASRGDVRLDPKDPQREISVAFNFFSDPRDLERMMIGFRHSAEMLADPALRSVCGDAFVLTNAAKLNRYNALSRANAIRGQLASALLRLSPGIAHRVISHFADMTPVKSFVNDERKLADFIVENVTATNHVTGTCRMGRVDDPEAVVDPQGRMIGLEGLTVADASIMPNVPSGNTHLATVMVAERIAEHLLRRGRA
ncbi:GMC family oxidoreductase [Telmatospirillum sp. J64-1]|uniref:GMC family oxidoreductase n=1 Tax=Telmatospirillum sp. J64-1 TaxID=2502183 RepID=UPI001C8F9547|nr:GMC family oxidoreductase N-terminal domain-containing protein [Telmatospirillum sp. J64-1]